MRLPVMVFLKVPMAGLPERNLARLPELILIPAAKYFVTLREMFLYRPGRVFFVQLTEEQPGQPLRRVDY